MSLCYAIKDWDKHFENSESRKIKSLTWLPVKNKHDGKGYRRVCQLPKSKDVFCAWNLIIQVASKMPLRGILRDEDGPLTASDLSFKTGYPEHIFEEAFKCLTDSKIGWLTKTEIGGNRENLPASPETSVTVGVEQNRTEQKGMEEQGNGQSLKGLSSKLCVRGDARGGAHAAQAPGDKPPAGLPSIGQCGTHLPKLPNGETDWKKVGWQPFRPCTEAETELIELCMEVLGADPATGGQWVQSSTFWGNKIMGSQQVKAEPDKVRRVMADTAQSKKDKTIKTTPAQYAMHQWRTFA